MSVTLVVKNSKMQSWETSGHKLNSNYWQSNKVFWQAIAVSPRQITYYYQINQRRNVVLLSNEEDILGIWRVV